MSVSEKSHSRPVAVVTGASAGIGAQFARRLAERGYDLILVARRADRLETLAGELAAHGASAETLQADLTAGGDVDRVCRHIESCERLELLVNNAGVGSKELFREEDRAGLDAMVRLHVLAVTKLTRAALPSLVRRGRGGVINVSSVAAFFQSPLNVLYCATKAFLNSFTEGLVAELAGTGVRAMALCPGFTYSEFHDVIGVDRSVVPRSWWLTAEYVVDEGLKDFGRGKIISIPGSRYKLVVWLGGLAPRCVRNFFARRRYLRLKGDSPDTGR